MGLPCTKAFCFLAVRPAQQIVWLLHAIMDVHIVVRHSAQMHVLPRSQVSDTSLFVNFVFIQIDRGGEN